MKIQGIHTRVLIVALLPAIAIAIVLGSYFINTRIQDLQQALVDRGRAIANQLAPASEYGVFSGNRDILRNLAESALREADVVRIGIHDSDHNVIVQAKHQGEAVLEHSDLLEFQAPILAPSLNISDFEEAQHPRDARPIGWIKVELSRAQTRQRQYQILLTSLLITVSVLIMTVVLALRISRDVSQPIQNLTHAIQRLGSGDLRVRVPEVSAGEIGLLEHGVNSMAGALENAQAELQLQVDQATAELRETLEAVEIQNVELDLARKRAIQTSREKSEFLANMSHEIRTPMNGLLGFIDLLLRTPLNAEQRDYTTTVRKSASNLLVIVNDILDFSKIESGKLSTESIPFDLREALEDSVDLMAPLAHEKGLEIILLIYSDVPLQLYGDANRIRQILLNLLGNALKFTHQGSVVVRVMLEENTDEVADEGNDEDAVSLRISVSDTGIGMTEEQLSRLFSAFSQADSSATRRFGGSGLGLFICKKLVEIMGGQIGVESAVGSGSTFWFNLRCLQQAEILDEDLATQVAGRRALIFDAHPLARLAVRHALEDWGLHITEVGDRTGLRETAGSQHFDLILAGVNLPESKDADLRNLVNQLANPERPLLILLNSIERERLKRVIAMGADECLSKPPRRDSLRRAVFRLLDAEPDAEGDFVERRKSPRPNMPDLRGARILLADDNEINRKLIGLQLETLGVEVSNAIDGRQALELANRHHFDLILMDVHMPELSGEQSAQAIRAGNGPNRNTPIVALTANAFTNEPQRLATSGINECLIKPISEYRLWEVVKRWTGHAADAPPESTTNGTAREEIFKELLAMLMAELPQQRNQLSTAFRGADWTTLRELAHKIRGSAAYCQVKPLEQACAELEAASATASREQIELAFRTVLARIDELLADTTETSEPSE